MAPATPGQWKGPQPPEKTYFDYCLGGWSKNPEKVAIIDINSAQEATFRQLEKSVRDFAGSLQAVGVQSGTRLQYYADNSLNTFVALQGALFCNASVFMFKPNKTIKQAEYRFQTVEAEVSVVLADAANYDLHVSDFLNDPECQMTKVIIVDGRPKKAMPADRVLFSDQLPKKEFEPPQDVRIREDVLLVSYTSGSTGKPKGVMHSNYSLITGLQNLTIPPIAFYGENDRFLVTSSLTYIAGILFTSGPLACGGSVILGCPEIEEDPLNYIEKYRATIFLMHECPTKILMKKIAKYPNVQQQVSSLRVALAGGSVFPEQLCEEIMQVFKGVPLQHTYGMTEAIGLISAPEAGPRLPRHVGFLAPHFEVKILNDIGRPVEVGEPGELLWKGPQRTLGYWKRETDDFTEDGYYKSGDLVTVDTDGNITIVGRKKHFIICLDERVSAAEIEGVLLQHEAVKEAVVVGIPHDVVGEAPTAMVVVNEGRETGEDGLAQELIEYVASQLSNEKHLYGGVKFVKTLPKTDSGKYARNKIMKKASALAGLG